MPPALGSDEAVGQARFPVSPTAWADQQWRLEQPHGQARPPTPHPPSDRTQPRPPRSRPEGSEPRPDTTTICRPAAPRPSRLPATSEGEKRPHWQPAQPRRPAPPPVAAPRTTRPRSAAGGRPPRLERHDPRTLSRYPPARRLRRQPYPSRPTRLRCDPSTYNAPRFYFNISTIIELYCILPTRQCPISPDKCPTWPDNRENRKAFTPRRKPPLPSH